MHHQESPKICTLNVTVCTRVPAQSAFDLLSHPHGQGVVQLSPYLEPTGRAVWEGRTRLGTPFGIESRDLFRGGVLFLLQDPRMKVTCDPEMSQSSFKEVFLLV